MRISHKTFIVFFILNLNSCMPHREEIALNKFSKSLEVDVTGTHTIESDEVVLDELSIKYKELVCGMVPYGRNLSTNCSGIELIEEDLSYTNLEEFDLSKANLQKTDLSYANLRGADLSEASLQGANLRGADLTGAYLNRTNLQGADLDGAALEYVDLSTSIYNEETIWTKGFSPNDDTGLEESFGNILD